MTKDDVFGSGSYDPPGWGHPGELDDPEQPTAAQGKNAVGDSRTLGKYSDSNMLNLQANITQHPLVGIQAESAPASRTKAFGQGASEKADVYAVKDMNGAQRSTARNEHVESLGDSELYG